jgi:peptidoglycan hydrolase-like protein with peptidoglycan-binding domain
LNREGFNCGEVDGIFGKGTKGQVIAFQKAKGLGADGIVGPKTREALV